MKNTDYIPDINDGRYCEQYEDFYDREENPDEDAYYDRCYEEALEEMHYHIM